MMTVQLQKGENMKAQEAVEKLDALIGTEDGEAAHAKADEILLEYVPQSVREAYERVQDSTGFWAFA